MPTKHHDLFAALASPFHPNEIKIRDGGHGRKLHYISAATAANRLDDVLGPENWDFEVQPWGTAALIGTLVIRLPDGSIVRKSNVGGRAGMAQDDDDAKSAASDVLKRCADLLGIGRYLRRDGVPEFVKERESMDEHTPNDSEHIDNHRPAPPSQGRPDRTQQQHVRDNNNGQTSGSGHHAPPRSGKALFAFCKDQEKQHGEGLINYLNKWSKLQEFPTKMIDWTPEQVAEGHQEALKAIARNSGQQTVPDDEREPADDFDS